jgi:hypothetical protein
VVVGLCVVAAATPVWPQAKSDSEPSRRQMTHLVEKPQMTIEVLQMLLRRMRGGETTVVKLAERNNPTPAHYTYSGRDFTGHYWEEEIGNREPISILGIWLSGFHTKCNTGRYLITSEAPFEAKGNLVHSGTWSCERKDMTLNGYFTVQKFASTVSIFFTLPASLEKQAAHGIATQIHATLVDFVRTQ